MNVKRFMRAFLGLGSEPRIKDTFASARLSFGDRVRVISSEVTDREGLSGRIGAVYGQTTPSVTGVTVIGSPSTDYAVSVHFENGEDAWLADELLELVDHGAGTTIAISGAANRWVRRSDGVWDEIADN